MWSPVPLQEAQHDCSGRDLRAVVPDLSWVRDAFRTWTETLDSTPRGLMCIRSCFSTNPGTGRPADELSPLMTSSLQTECQSPAVPARHHLRQPRPVARELGLVGCSALCTSGPCSAAHQSLTSGSWCLTVSQRPLPHASGDAVVLTTLAENWFPDHCQSSCPPGRPSAP